MLKTIATTTAPRPRYVRFDADPATIQEATTQISPNTPAPRARVWRFLAPRISRCMRSTRFNSAVEKTATIVPQPGVPGKHSEQLACQESGPDFHLRNTPTPRSTRAAGHCTAAANSPKAGFQSASSASSSPPG